MALALRFAEEGEFSSRATEISYVDEPEVPLSNAIFRWSKRVREHLQKQTKNGILSVHTGKLIVAMPGGPEKFLEEIMADWHHVGTLIVTDQPIQPCRLQSESTSPCIILSKHPVEGEFGNSSELDNILAIRITQDVPARSTWTWLNKLQQHINAKEIICLDSQLSTIYGDTHSSESVPFLRMLATSSVGEESRLEYPVRPLETPQFTTGIPAALLTHRHSSSERRESTGSSCEFSTRLLPSDGIPEYNALLDTHLGKRREFLLGNKQSLTLLQRTGVIARVETKEDNPNQYVVYMADKPIHRRKRLPPRHTTGSKDAIIPGSWSLTHRKGESVNVHATGQKLKKSETAPVLPPHTKSGVLEGQAIEECESEDDRDEFPDEQPFLRKHPSVGHTGISESSSEAALIGDRNSGKIMMKRLGRSQTTGVLTHRVPLDVMRVKSIDSSNLGMGHEKNTEVGSPSLGIVNQFRPRSMSVCTPAHPTHLLEKIPPCTTMMSQTPVSKKIPAKGTVEYLLESDAAYLIQINTMKDLLTDLDQERAHLDGEISKLRMKLRGVNAVHENDVAVAHCSSIMQHRLSKAEEEYMKLVTSQQQVKKDVDRVRRELLSLHKVKKKLEVDIDDVTQVNTAIKEKIHASKQIRNLLSEELVELERKAELVLEEQKHNLPPEEAIVVDAAKLMNAVQERVASRRISLPSTIGPTSPIKFSPAIMHAEQLMEPGKPHLDYQTIFRVIQNSLGLTGDINGFVQAFAETEDQLLSKYKVNMALEEEIRTMNKEFERLSQESAARLASIRGNHEVTVHRQNEVQVKIRLALSRIGSYNELRELRNQEHTRLRSIMQRCLEVLRAEKTLNRQEYINGPMLMSELSSPALLEALQKKVTEVAMVLKMKRSAEIAEDSRNCYRPNRVHDGRRSNVFSTREASKIILGPREPTGSALSAILTCAHPPSVEAALALTETHSIEGNHTLITAISPAKLSLSRGGIAAAGGSPKRNAANILMSLAQHRPESPIYTKENNDDGVKLIEQEEDLGV